MALRNPGDDQLILAHFASHRSAGTDSRPLRHRHWGHQLSIGADEDMILDDGFVLVGAIVVTGDELKHQYSHQPLSRYRPDNSDDPPWNQSRGRHS